ncbi:MAG: hypothetical protein M1822_008883 [Bathelium mastoideum]|nr:MAG: hypothetical protein M1822_008883 [Bathelium mastoideum]
MKFLHLIFFLLTSILAGQGLCAPTSPESAELSQLEKRTPGSPGFAELNELEERSGRGGNLGTGSANTRVTAYDEMEQSIGSVEGYGNSGNFYEEGHHVALTKGPGAKVTVYAEKNKQGESEVHILRTAGRKVETNIKFESLKVERAG